jgi:predicted GIY-YIG superfamily endonuclease
MKTHLYRHYDKQGDLLYVGISANAYARLAQHHLGADWPSLAVRMDTEVFDTREAAHEAERMAIRVENPRFNRERYKKRASEKAAAQGRAHGAELSRREVLRKRAEELSALEIRMSKELTLANQGLRKLCTLRTSRLAIALTGESLTVNVSATDFSAMYGLDLNIAYTTLAEAAEELRGAVATIEGVQVPWTKSCEYAHGVLTLEWHADMFPHICSRRGSSNTDILVQ